MITSLKSVFSVSVLILASRLGAEIMPSESRSKYEDRILQSNVLQNLTQLVRSDAQQLERLKNVVEKGHSHEDEAAFIAPGPMLSLPPMVIAETREKNPVVYRETRTSRFFRTGVIAEHIGKEVTVCLGFDPLNKGGIYLSISF